MYHRVMQRVPGPAQPPDCVAVDRFHDQLDGLLLRGHEIRPLRELLASRAEGKALPPRTIAVTFDDGYECIHRHAWPVLRELRIPATVFLATGYLGSSTPFPFDPWGVTNAARVPPAAYRPMTLDQCRELAAGGLIDFGAHTHTHRDFRGRPGAAS